MPNAKDTMRNHIQTILFIVTLTTFSTAQNLVPNPSFEIYSTCPTAPNQTNRAIPWYDPTGASSDYYNACASTSNYVNVPNTGNGHQNARTGVAYTGLFALNGLGDGSREYIQVQLISPLIQDSCYAIEFYCNQTNYPLYSIKTLGAYLGVTNSFSLSSIPQVVSSSFLTDTLNWMYISGYYTASGGEKFLTIGNFKPFSAGDTLLTIPQSSYHYPGAYYYIEDVSITMCSQGTGINDYKPITNFKLYPNPTNQSATLEFNNPAKDNCTLILYDSFGRIIQTVTNITTDKIEINGNNLAVGLYFFQLHTDKKVIATGKLKIEQ